VLGPAVVGVLVGVAWLTAPSSPASSRAACPIIEAKRTCLKVGQKCRPALESAYRRHGLHCSTRRRLVRGPTTPAPRPISVNVVGSPITVFNWKTERCEANDIPDLPARAFRDASGAVQLISTHYVNRRFFGPDLDHLSHPCDVILRSDFDADPSSFNDHEWLAAPYTPDGRTVYALVHDEYHAYDHAGQCSAPPSEQFDKCWYNAITLAISIDGGKTYADHPAPRLVAAIPQKYSPNTGPAGMFTPSNIVRNAKDGFYYALAYVNVRQKYIGNCLMRTRRLDDPRSWRTSSSGGGTTFNRPFVDPYGPEASTGKLCVPISTGEPRDVQPNSLLYSTVAHQWILVGQALGGAYFSLSPNLVTWSRPKLFWRAQVTWNYLCGDPDPIAYPSLIDPASPSRNFETVGARAYLYYTQFHYSNCAQTLDRDLVRLEVNISTG